MELVQAPHNLKSKELVDLKHLKNMAAKKKQAERSNNRFLKAQQSVNGIYLENEPSNEEEEISSDQEQDFSDEEDSDREYTGNMFKGKETV